MNKLTPDYAGVRLEISYRGKMIDEFKTLDDSIIGFVSPYLLVGIELPGLMLSFSMSKYFVSSYR